LEKQKVKMFIFDDVQHIIEAHMDGRPKAPPQRRVRSPRFKPKAEKTERPNPHGLFSAQYILDRCGPN
jgi:hypothetical protein